MGEKLLANIVWVLARLGLAPNEQTVYITMALHVFDEAQKGRPVGLYWAKRSTLRAQTGLGETAMKVALAGLIHKGWLIRESDGKPGRTANYRFPLDRLNELLAVAKREMEKAESAGNPTVQSAGNPTVQSAGNPTVQSAGNPTPEDSIEDSIEEEGASAPAPISIDAEPPKGCAQHPANDSDSDCRPCAKQRTEVYEPWVKRRDERRRELQKLDPSDPRLYRDHEHIWTTNGMCKFGWCPATNPALQAA